MLEHENADLSLILHHQIPKRFKVYDESTNRCYLNEFPKKIIYNPDIASISEMRDSARELLSRCGNNSINPDTKEELTSTFRGYCSTVEKRKLVLMKNYFKNASFGSPEWVHNKYNAEFRILPFKTRFTDYSYVKNQLQKYNDFWDNMELAGYKTAVFLTATFDPSKFIDRIDIVKKSAAAMNRMKSYLKKSHNRKLPSLAIPEFTKNGILHFHIIFFGTSYLKNHKKLTGLMQKWGFGKIHFEYSIYKRNGSWTGKKFKNSNPKNYLKKYLLKNLNNSSLDGEENNDFQSSLFWATNKRWFSTSRIKYTNHTHKGVDLINAIRIIQTPKYSFWGSYNHFSEIPDYILLNREDFRSDFYNLADI